MRAVDELSRSGPDGPDLPELAAVLDVLPLAALILAESGSALAVNEEWAWLSAVPRRASLGAGWLGAVAPADREPLRRLLAEAVVAGQRGSADVRLAGSGGGRPSRWWWRPGGPGQLVVCVAGLDRDNRSAPAPLTPAEDAVARLVHRMFGVGLVLESAAGLAGEPVRDRLRTAIGELDAIIRDTRTALFAAEAGSGISGAEPGDDPFSG